MRLSTRLGGIALDDGRSDQPVALASYWREQPVVLVFVRHFG